MMLIVMEKKENIMFFSYDEIKDIKNIEKYFEIKPEGNWENKIILVEKEKPNKEILKKLLKLDQKEINHFLMIKLN